MNNLNSILIEGNLTKDPESYTTPNGNSLCKFSLASNRYYKKDDDYQQEVSFFTIECWAKLAESCITYLHKGRAVRIIGRLKQERWNSKEGNPRERVVITAEHVEFGAKYKHQTTTDEETEEETEEAGLEDNKEHEDTEVFAAEN